MKNTLKITFGGILTAFSVIILMLGNIPFAEYVGPTFGGLILIWSVVEMGYVPSTLIFASTAVLSLFLSANKEPAVLYAAFFGYYSILRELLEEKVRIKVIKWIIKFVVFNVSVVAAYAVLIYIFGMPLDEIGGLGKYSLVIMLALGNLLFLVYDFAVKRIKFIYLKVWQKRFHKIMKIK